MIDKDGLRFVLRHSPQAVYFNRIVRLCSFAPSCFSSSIIGLTEVTDVTASANGWDTRVGGSGCAPNGCLPSNVLDNSIEPASRWSCQAASAGIDVCELTLEFDAPQDLVQMDMAFYKGDERTRSVNVWVDGVLLNTITSSGETADYETYPLVAHQASIVVLQAVDLGNNGWLSITEVTSMHFCWNVSAQTLSAVCGDRSCLT